MLHNNTANVNKHLLMLRFSAYYYGDASNFCSLLGVLKTQTYLIFLKDITRN